MAEEKRRYLDTIDSPADLKRLRVEELEAVCAELREYILECCAVNPGHLGSSLGAVELAVALHYVYDTPADRLVWDVGHQAYAHKILTGRREAFLHNRTRGGISGFPRMAESEYDAFGGGHSSVSISAAFGMAKAIEMQGGKERVVAIIGDGALTGGLAFEALNNAGVSPTTDLLVVLNDNEMSIDEPAGALDRYLVRMSTSKWYNSLKRTLWRMLSVAPPVLNFIRKSGNAIKQGLLKNSNLFESLNFRYFGPIDGHDIETLISTLTALKEIGGPKLLHIKTKKGKGYAAAEADPSIWHAPGRFDVATGERIKSVYSADRYQDVFGVTLLDLAKSDERIVGVTPAMPSGCSMNIVMREMPDRCFDVGIAEGHAVTFSAGLAVGGSRPFCNIYSSFMQRAYDNVIHDVALQNLPVVLCLDRAGLVGEDGATHHGAFDLAYFGCVPNITIAAPRNEWMLRQMMYTASMADHPTVIRYPRGRGVLTDWKCPLEELPIGKGRKLKEGKDMAVITLGPIGNLAAKAIERAEQASGKSIAHYDLRFLKPLDEAMLHEIGKQFKQVITIEDGALNGGMGSAVLEFMADNNYQPNISRIGIPDKFIEHGTIPELYKICGMDEESIVNKILANL